MTPQIKKNSVKGNVAFTFGIPSLFIVLGIYLITDVAEQSLTNPFVIKVLGIVMIVFFGSLLVYGFFKFIKKELNQ